MTNVLAQRLLKVARRLMSSEYPEGDVPLEEEDEDAVVAPEVPSLTHVEQNVTPFLGPPRTKKLP